jgi:hypothetical protein
MNIARILSKVGDHLFLIGFIIARFRLLPLPILPIIVNILSLIFYLLGYILSIIAYQLSPDHPSLPNTWYGFSQFKTQSKISAMLGLAATTVCFMVFISPLAVIPVLWLFAMSNVFWCLAEYHKFNNPLAYENDYLPARQQSYLGYAFIMTILSIFSAIATTITLLCPATAVVILPISMIVTILLSLAALNYWIDSNFSYLQYQSSQSSYQLMTNKLIDKQVYKKTPVIAPTTTILKSATYLMTNLSNEEPIVIESRNNTIKDTDTTNYQYSNHIGLTN